MYRGVKKQRIHRSKSYFSDSSASESDYSVESLGDSQRDRTKTEVTFERWEELITSEVDEQYRPKFSRN